MKQNRMPKGRRSIHHETMSSEVQSSLEIGDNTGGLHYSSSEEDIRKSDEMEDMSDDNENTSDEDGGNNIKSPNVVGNRFTYECAGIEDQQIIENIINRNNRSASRPPYEYTSDNIKYQQDIENNRNRSASRSSSYKYSGVNVKDESRLIEKYKIYIILGIVPISIICMLYYKTLYNIWDPHKEKVNCNDFKSLKLEFPNLNDEIWLSLKLSLEAVINNEPPKPAVFLYAYQDKENFDKIMDKILDLTTKCLNTVAAPLILQPENFTESPITTDYGIRLSKLTDELKKSGVLFISDVNKISGYVAQVFHSICDIDNPSVPRSVTFLTMQLEYLPQRLNLISFVESQLTEVWSKTLDSEKLSALITRVTDQLYLL